MQDIVDSITARIAAGLTTPDLKVPASRKFKDGAGFTLYKRDALSGVLIYVANANDEDGDPCALLSVWFEATGWRFEACRCDKLVRPEDVLKGTFPIARPSHGINKCIAAVRKLWVDVYADGGPHEPIVEDEVDNG